jgi:hypothetical protein
MPWPPSTSTDSIVLLLTWDYDGLALHSLESRRGWSTRVLYDTSSPRAKATTVPLTDHGRGRDEAETEGKGKGREAIQAPTDRMRDGCFVQPPLFLENKNRRTPAPPARTTRRCEPCNAMSRPLNRSWLGRRQRRKFMSNITVIYSPL